MKKYIVFHKPTGCVTARSDQKHKTVMDYFPEGMRDELHPVGRLDKDTEGLLLITNDGKWNQDLMDPGKKVTKEYFFVVLGGLSDEWIRQLEEGIVLQGEENRTAPANLSVVDTMTLVELPLEYREKVHPKILKNPSTCPVTLGKIIISEGKKHQVKRMLKAAGCYVIYLKRNAVGQLRLEETLEPGMWRNLKVEELKVLQRK